ncbi:putative membrane protein [Corynebacterium deserti GIMN1.010]|uniref:Putative membrane protein n=1 Tax=Corynebacterium deserti GIMN1.010 TaxID=931089 RepID=A0A0M4CJC8_9CORY|nr:hypothetical protein [Corynebacterium deserti]ALC05838.1 putative membrane protein [Corynebacterium deserti GIMN1.010]
MMAARMIPALWFRLLVLLGFTGFMVWEAMWLFAGIGVLLIAVSGWQLRAAYTTRGDVERQRNT